MMARVDEAARVLQVDVELAAASTKRGMWKDAIAKQRPFGTRRDIEGSLQSIVGYLDDKDLARISATFRESQTYRALGSLEKLTADTVRTFVNASIAR